MRRLNPISSIAIVTLIAWNAMSGPISAALPQTGDRDSVDLSNFKTVTWTVGGVARKALVYAPPSAGQKRALVFGFHGHGGNSAKAARSFALQRYWPQAVCVYPQGLPTAAPSDPEGKQSGWQGYVGHHGDRDLAFFDAMLKTLIADYQIDEKQVYASGFSNGGYFTYALLAARADRFAALAPIAATLNSKDHFPQALPILHVVGEKDRLVSFAAQQKSLEQLRQLNSCEPEGKRVGKWCVEYHSNSGTPVVVFIHPGEHEIPKDAPEAIVRFFQSHPKPD